MLTLRLGDCAGGEHAPESIMVEHAEEQAGRVVCRACGAPLPVDLEMDVAVCEGCGARHVVPVALRQRARVLGRGAASAADRELDARWVEALHEQSARIVRTTMRAFAAGLVGCVPVLAFWVTHVFAKLPFWVVVVVVALFCVPWLLFFESVAASMRSPRAKRGEIPESAVRCDGCGAVVPARAGVIVDACGYCGSANMIPLRTAWELVIRANRRATTAEAGASAARAQNTASVDRARRSAGVHHTGIFVGALVVATLIAIVPAVVLARGPEITETGWIAYAVGLVFVYGAVRTVIAFRGFMRAARSSGALDARRRIERRG